MQNESNSRIVFAARFDKQLRKLPSEIIAAFDETYSLFKDFPHHEYLRRHNLKDKYAGHQSIDVTADYRVIFKEKKTKNQILITFHLIGTHEELYGK